MNWKSAQERKRRLKKLCTNNGRAWFNDRKDRYIRYYTSGSTKRFFKNYSNRLARRDLRLQTEETLPREKSYFKNGAYVDSWDINDW